MFLFAGLLLPFGLAGCIVQIPQDAQRDTVVECKNPDGTKFLTDLYSVRSQGWDKTLWPMCGPIGYW